MPLRVLLRYLMNNEHLIQKVAESYPIRRAAQLTAFMFHRGKELGEEGFEKLRDSGMVQRARKEAVQSRRRASSFSDTFMKELQQGLKDMGDKTKKDR